MSAKNMHLNDRLTNSVRTVCWWNMQKYGEKESIEAHALTGDLQRTKTVVENQIYVPNLYYTSTVIT